MAINKNFVIKNGAEVNTKLLVADAVTQKVGIGTTVPTYSLHVFGPNEQPGSIGATVVNVTGVTTTKLLVVGTAATFSEGPVFIGVGQSTGTPLQNLQVGSATTVKGVYISGDTGIGATFPGAKLQVVPESTRIAGLFTGSTSNDMVRITQTGSGNALSIDDAANPDVTPFIVDALGNTGIGTDAARAKLHVLPVDNGVAGLFSGSTSNDMVRITQWGDGNALVIEDTSNPDATAFIVKANGDVGIGINSEAISAKLYVVPESPAPAGIFTGATAGDMVRITQTGAGNAFVVEDEVNADASPFVIRATGDTGIGTNVPGGKLHVTPTATGVAGIFSGTTSNDMVRITQTGTGNALLIEDETNIDASPFVIDALGEVGIGTTLPGAKLHVIPTSTSIAGLFTGSTSDDMVRITQTGSGNAFVVEDESNTDATSFVISGLGSVGIGTSVPRYLLDIDGTKFASEGLAVGQTSVYIRGDVKIVGDLSVDDITLDQIVNNYLNVSGFGTISSLLVPNTASINVGIITSIQGGNLTLAGISSFINAPGISTLGFIQNTTLNVTGFSTLGSVRAGNVILAGITTGLNAPGISTFGDITASDLFLAGITTGLNASGISTLGFIAGQSAAYTGISTLTRITGEDINTTGIATIARLNVPGISTIGFLQNTTLNVSGFSTLGSISGANLILAGITTGLNAPGISTFGDITASDLLLAGITTGLNATGISTLVSLTGTSANFSGINTLSSLTGTNVNYTGVGTIANVQSTNLNVSGITTVNDFTSNGSFNVFAADATFHNNVTINGNLSIGGTSTIINATQLRVEDKDIVLGFTTSQLPTDDTANHGGIAIASTEGYPLVSLSVTGINTLPDTYKQIMWVKRDTMGAGTTDAFLFNYGVGIGSTQVPNGTRLAVGAVQITDDAVNARIGNLTSVRGTNINVTGVGTIGNLLITPSASGIGATVGSAAGIVTYYGDGANLTGVSIGIQSGGNLIGYGVTTLNFIGAGNTFAYNPATKTVDISIQGGSRAGFATYVAGIATAASVGVNTTNLDDPDLTGIGNSFQGLYIGNGMLIVDNALNGNHYIGTNFNGLMAGPVTINGTLTIDGNWVVV